MRTRVRLERKISASICWRQNFICFALFRWAPMVVGSPVEFDRMEVESPRRRKGGDREPV
jgi:hypothetical protein